jgi:hypothetical protein
MCLLYFVGVFAGLGLVMRREGRKLPLRSILLGILAIGLVAGGITFLILHFHVHLSPKWPYIVR